MFMIPPCVTPLAGVLVDALSGTVAVLLGFTGFFGGAARYGAILANRPIEVVERRTGIGFFAGSVAGMVVIALDALAMT